MPKILSKLLLAVALCGLVTILSTATADTPKINGPILTWHLDPTSTMTISWIEHSGLKKPATPEEAPSLYWRKNGDEKWAAIEAKTRPFADTGNLIRSVTLEGLMPDTEFEFKLPEDYADRTGKFRTAPADGSKPIRFVTGGDMFHNREWLDSMNARAGAEDPLFALLGGDLAYANAKAASGGMTGSIHGRN